MDDLFETRTEYRLTGQPPGDYPPYDFTATAENVAAVKKIWEAADGRNWTDVRFTTRQVTITRTEWTDYEPGTDRG
jgi:hypothetical protein